MRSQVLALCAAAAGLTGTALGQETLYAIDSPTFPLLYTLDKETGQVISTDLVTNYEALFGGLAIDDAGTLFSIDGFNDANSDRLFSIDRETGEGAVVGETGFNWNFRCVSVHPQTDVLYASRDNELFTIDKATGAATSIAPITGPTLDQLTAFAIDPTGTAYGTDIGDTGLFEIDLATGQATHLGNLGESNWFHDLAFDADGTLYGSRLQGGTFVIDIDTVSLELQFGTSYVGLVFFSEGGDCAADCDGNGTLNVLDFVCFQQEWQAQTPTGDCDDNGVYNVLDFVCFQQVFQAGCP